MHRACDDPRSHHRHLPAVEELLDLALGYRLCGGAAQCAAAGAAAALVRRHPSDVPERAAGDQHLRSDVHQPTRRQHAATDSRGGFRARGDRPAGWHRHCYRHCALGTAPSDGDRPAIPQRLGRPRSHCRAASGHGPGAWQSGDLGGAGVQGLQLPGRDGGAARTDGGHHRHQCLHRFLHRRDCSRRHFGRQPRPDGGGSCTGPQTGHDAAPRDHSAIAADHRAADDQPVSQHCEEHDAGQHGGLSGSVFGHRHLAQSDRPAGGEHRDHDGVLPDDQHPDLAVHELVQQAHRAG